MSLTARQERVIRERFGFNCRPKTLKEIGAEFDRSTDRIRQIEAQALRELKKRAMRLKRIQNRRCGTRVKVNFSGANYGITTAPPPPKARPYPKEWEKYYRLVPIINEMAAAGKSTVAIQNRLVADYRAATWMDQRKISKFIPCLNAIAYIMRVGTLKY